MNLSRFWEALTDPKAIAFFLYPSLSNLIGGVGVQYSLIIRDFGFTTLQTTILTIPGGVAMITSICLGGFALRMFPVRRTRPFGSVIADTTPEFADNHLSRLIHPFVPVWRITDRTSIS